MPFLFLLWMNRQWQWNQAWRECKIHKNRGAKNSKLRYRRRMKMLKEIRMEKEDSKEKNPLKKWLSILVMMSTRNSTKRRTTGRETKYFQNSSWNHWATNRESKWHLFSKWERIGCSRLNSKPRLSNQACSIPYTTWVLIQVLSSHKEQESKINHKCHRQIIIIPPKRMIVRMSQMESILITAAPLF